MQTPDDTELVQLIQTESAEVHRLVLLYDHDDRKTGIHALVAAIERLNTDALQAALFMAVAAIAEIRSGRATPPPRKQPEHVDV